MGTANLWETRCRAQRRPAWRRRWYRRKDRAPASAVCPKSTTKSGLVMGLMPSRPTSRTPAPPRPPTPPNPCLKRIHHGCDRARRPPEHDDHPIDTPALRRRAGRRGAPDRSSHHRALDGLSGREPRWRPPGPAAELAPFIGSGPGTRTRSTRLLGPFSGAQPQAPSPSRSSAAAAPSRPAPSRRSASSACAARTGRDTAATDPAGLDWENAWQFSTPSPSPGT